VLLPVWRAPVTMTAGMTRNARATAEAAWRGSKSIIRPGLVNDNHSCRE
jgi:hypothetical protein